MNREEARELRQSLDQAIDAAKSALLALEQARLALSQGQQNVAFAFLRHAESEAQMLRDYWD